MKLNIKYIIGVAAVATLGMVSCTDEIKFGNAFLEKAPGGTVTADEVFSNPEYTRNFLASIYSTQYYNLPTNSTNAAPQCQNYWKGMPDALGDDFHLFFNNTTVFSKYYAGALSSAIDDKKNGNIYPYTNEFIWENVRHSWMLIERINEVPDMSDAEKARIADEARCLLAYTYFNRFPLVWRSAYYPPVVYRLRKQLRPAPAQCGIYRELHAGTAGYSNRQQSIAVGLHRCGSTVGNRPLDFGGCYGVEV